MPCFVDFRRSVSTHVLVQMSAGGVHLNLLVFQIITCRGSRQFSINWIQGRKRGKTYCKSNYAVYSKLPGDFHDWIAIALQKWGLSNSWRQYFSNCGKTMLSSYRKIGKLRNLHLPLATHHQPKAKPLDLCAQCLSFFRLSRCKTKKRKLNTEHWNVAVIRNLDEGVTGDTGSESHFFGEVAVSWSNGDTPHLLLGMVIVSLSWCGWMLHQIH